MHCYMHMMRMMTDMKVWTQTVAHVASFTTYPGVAQGNQAQFVYFYRQWRTDLME